MEGISLISTLAIGFGVALVLGFLAEKLKVPALVGYLLAGILVSPSVFGFDVDLNLANQLAEIGIMLLMFGVGLLLDGSFEGQRTSRSGRDMPDALVCLDWVRFELAMGMGYRTLRASRVLLVLRFYRSRA